MTWVRGDQCSSADSERSLTAARGVDWLHKSVRVDPRYLPILRTGDKLTAPEALSPIHVYRGHTLIAVVMPMRPGAEASVLVSEVSRG